MKGGMKMVELSKPMGRESVGDDRNSGSDTLIYLTIFLGGFNIVFAFIILKELFGL